MCKYPRNEEELNVSEKGFESLSFQCELKECVAYLDGFSADTSTFKP